MNQLDLNVYWDEDDQVWTARWIFVRNGQKYGNLIHLSEAMQKQLKPEQGFDMLVALAGDDFFSTLEQLLLAEREPRTIKTDD